MGGHLPSLPKDLGGQGSEIMAEMRAGCSAGTSSSDEPKAIKPPLTPCLHIETLLPFSTFSMMLVFAILTQLMPLYEPE